MDAMREGPRGNGYWPSFSHVYGLIAQGCENMARNPYQRCADDHVQSMADLGSGHEDRMKYRLQWMRTYGYVA